MLTTLRSFPVLAALALGLSARAFAQGNALTLNNGGDLFFYYSDPSVGAPAGTYPPLLTGDLWWKVIPGQALGAGSGMVEIEGLLEILYDTDWSVPPAHFYDMSFDPVVGPGNEPAYFTTGTVGTFVSLGPTGLASPCTIAPSICSPASCYYPKWLIGWQLDVSFGSTPGTGIMIPADNVSGTAVTHFVPGGMSTAGGPCFYGDYFLQDIHSTDETQADVLGSGSSSLGGFQLAGSGPILEGLNSTWAGHVRIREGIVQTVADSGTGLGFEDPWSWPIWLDVPGGALNGVNLETGSGAAKVKALVSCAQCPPGLAFAAASLTPIAPPGFPFLGEALLIKPNGPFLATLGIWQAPHVGATLLPEIPIPPWVAGTALWIQGGVLDLAGSSLSLTTSFGLKTF